MAWLIDAVLDYFIYYKGNISDLLSMKSGREIFFRLIILLAIVIIGWLISRAINEIRDANKENEILAGKLKNALDDNKKLSGLIPICSSCKKVRDDQGCWNKIEYYIEEHSEAEFTHGVCPECANKLRGS